MENTIICVIFRKSDFHIVECYFDESSCVNAFLEYEIIYPGQYDWRVLNLNFLVQYYLTRNY